MFILFKVNQIVLCLVIIISSFSKSEIKSTVSFLSYYVHTRYETVLFSGTFNFTRNFCTYLIIVFFFQHYHDDYRKPAPYWSGTYDILKPKVFLPTYHHNNPHLFHIEDFVFGFKAIYCCVALSILTIIIIIGIIISIKCARRRRKIEIKLLFILVSLWIPITISFLWLVIINWSEDKYLSQYRRPMSLVVASVSCLSLTACLIIELFFNYVSEVNNQFLPIPSIKVDQNQEFEELTEDTLKANQT